jgi:hypothetical protein
VRVASASKAAAAARQRGSAAAAAWPKQDSVILSYANRNDAHRVARKCDFLACNKIAGTCLLSVDSAIPERN